MRGHQDEYNWCQSLSTGSSVPVWLVLVPLGVTVLIAAVSSLVGLPLF